MNSALRVLLGLGLLAAPPAVAESPSVPSCAQGMRYIELAADATGKPPEVCIRPGVSTSLSSDSKWVRVELEGRELFRWVLEGENALAFMPSEALRDGDRLRLTVYFGDGAAPESATFMLVVHPSQAERQVEVSRHPRSVTSYQQEARQARAEALQCREEKAHLQAECAGQGGLTGLISHRLVDEGGVVSQELSRKVVQQPGELLIPKRVHSYRSTTRSEEGNRKVLRAAVEVDLLNGGPVPWKVAGAALIGPNGETLRVLRVWQPEHIPLRESRPVVVEVEALEGELEGSFTLKLWGEDGAGSVTLDGIMFP